MAVNPEAATPVRRIGVTLRGDLQVVHQRRNGEDHAVIKDPHSLRFFEMSWIDFNLASCLQNGMTAPEIVADWRTQMPAMCTGQDDAELAARAERLCTAVRQLGLGQDSGWSRRAAPAAMGWGGWFVAWARRISAPMFVRVRLFDPDDFLARVVARWRPLFSMPALFVASAFVLVSAAACVGHLDEMNFHPEWFRVWQHLAGLYLGILVLKVIHESGHALVCKAFGGHVHEVGAQLLAFHPTFFVDVSDTWMWPDRRRRIAVAAAGFGAEMAAAAALFWLWRLLSPGFARDLCLNLMFIASISAVLFNANPLMRYDGYHMLADFLREPHLRQKAFGTLGRAIRRAFFGARLVPRERGPRRWIFALYAVLSSVYLVWIAFIVAGFLRKMLAPLGLEIAGHVLLAAWLVSMVLPVVRFFGAIVHDTATLGGRERARPLLVGGALLACVAFLAFAPLPVRVERECVIEVSAPGVVRASQPGVIAGMLVSEGQRVSKGQPIARLRNRTLALESGQAAIDVDLTRIALLSAVGDNAAGHVQQAMRRLNEARANDAQSRRRIEELELHSPCDGVVVTRLLERKPGQFVRPGDEVVSIAGDDAREILLPLTEKEARHIREGAPVRFRSKAFPGVNFSGRISTAALRLKGDNLPRALTALAGGEIAIDAAGKVFSSEVTHVSRCVIAPADPRLRPGLTGRARLDCGHLPAAEWLFEQVLDAIHLEHRL